MIEYSDVPSRSRKPVEEIAYARDRLMETGSEFQPVKRDEIIGIDNILKEIDIIVAWLQNPEEFTRHGTRLEPGLLLEGSPGTGKTLCSRYIASCSDALFINVRDWPLANDLITAEDLHDLFHRARSYYADTHRPVIVFWDEFENFAKERERSSMSMRDASVVSQLTAELDGIVGKCPGLLFIGCTNYKRTIDEALLRPGRMGLHIKFVAPDRAGKAKLLKHYVGKFNCKPNLDMTSASYFFNEDDTAAAVEEAVHKVWLHAVRQSIGDKSDPIITQDQLNAVLLETLLGPPPPFMELREDSERAVAIHELGHALVAHYLGVPVRVVTIQPGRDTFGRVITHNVDPKIANVDDVRNQIAVGLGSIAAELEAGLPNSAHATSDTKTATALALRLVDELGQNSNTYGPINIESFTERNVYITGAISLELLSDADQRVGQIVEYAYRKAKSIMDKVGRARLYQMAEYLMRDKTWTGKQFDEIYGMLSMPEHDSGRSHSNGRLAEIALKTVPLD